MAIPDYTSVEDWDIVFLGGARMPGVASVEVKGKSGLDKRKAKGSKKGRAADQGEPPIEFDIDLELQPHELNAFQAALNTLRAANKGETKQPISIAHPQAAMVGVALVMVGSFRLPHPKGGSSYRASIEVIEWKAPKKLATSAKKPAPEKDDFGNESDIDALIQALSPANFESAEGQFSSDPSLYQNQSTPDQATLFTPG